MTDDQIAQLQAVNNEVNAIPFNAVAAAHEPSDLWKDAPDDGSWVCRDYVLRKAELLRGDGWPAESLTVVECYTEPVGPDAEREYHAVLAVADGDASSMILDSRFDDLYRMNEPLADYRWDRRQIAGTTNFEPISAV